MNIVNCLDRHMGAGGPDDNAAQARHLIPSLARSVTTREGQRLGDCQDTIIPIDLGQTSRGEKMTNNRANGGPPGTGIGNNGDPAFTVRARGQAIAYRTSGNCGVMEQGDRTAALNTGTDPNQNIVAYQCHGSNVGPMGHLRAGNGNETGGVPFVFEPRVGRNDRGQPSGIVNTLKGSEAGDASDMRPCIAGGNMRVRRLMPIECERLQGFPDEWTKHRVDGTVISDSARYRMIGNAVAVPVAQWIGKRIIEIDASPQRSDQGE